MSMECPSGDEVPMEVCETPSALDRSLRQEYPPIEVEPLPPTENFEAGNGPRLMITNIVNENFKSYAGIQRLGPFHKNFSAIVGPNGSGKSNVIDSMLFVFGYRANKIRSKKISVLIHASEQHRNLTSCTVTVNFQKIIDTGDGDDDFDIVPNSQFCVSRTASKDNSSFYCVDERRCTYKDVAKLLRGSGIDLDHNRFLILQGEVEQIAMMKPKAQTEHDEGMLEFLEDIIGSSRYKTPIETLQKRIEQLNEIRTEKLNRVKVVEKEKDELEDAKNEAIEYLTIENDKTKLEHQAFHKYVYDLTKLQEDAQKKKEAAAEKMKASEDVLKSAHEEKKQHAKELKDMSKKFESCSKEYERLKEKFSEFEKRDVKTREDMKHATAQSKKLEKNHIAEEKKVEDLKKVPFESEKHIGNLQKKLKILEKDKEKEEENLRLVMESLKTETQGLQNEKEEKEKILVDLKKAVNNTQSTYNLAKSELDLILSAQQNEQQKLADAQSNLEKAKNELKEKEKYLGQTTDKIPHTEQAINKVQNDLDAAAKHESELNNEVKNLRVHVGEARTNFNSAKSQNKVLDALMREKQAGRLPGIYGRLGDLGAIDEQYDIAVSTACPQLDNIVVDTMDTAQKCVQFLRANNVGRGTFIGLDKQERWKQNCNNKINTPENVPRLFDLIRVRNKNVLPAFYFALRDTLVCSDLTQARRVAYGAKRFRCVTLQGQMIEITGAMSGGGGRPIKGKMGSRVAGEEISPAELAEMEKTLQKREKEIETSRNNKIQMEHTFTQLKKDLRQMKNTKDKVGMEMQSLTSKKQTLNKLIGELEQKVQDTAPDEKKLKNLQKQVDQSKKEFDKASKIADSLEAEVKELHEQIMDYGGAKLKVVQSKLDMINQGVDAVTGQITKANVSINTTKRNLKKSEEKLVSLEQEIKENVEHLQKLKEELAQLDVEAQEVVEQTGKQEEMMNEEKAVLQEKRRIVAELEEREDNVQKQMVSLKHEVSERESTLSGLNAKKSHWEQKLSKLKLQEIDGVEMEPLTSLDPEILATVNLDLLGLQITATEEKLHSLKPNMAAIAEYRKKEEIYLRRVGELDEVTDVRNQQRKNYDDLRKQRLDEFMTGFSIVTSRLKELYQMITLGGDAELELVDSLDPFSEGIVFSVRPPKKSWKNISNLSGGEKTLSSLALVFALHTYKPTPLYVMDEIDAALDYKNVSIVAHYIKERTKNAQFIIISLRNNMFELADRLVGIYKTYDATKSVTLNPKKMIMTVLQEVEPTS